jgi:hypothetical protein
LKPWPELACVIALVSLGCAGASPSISPEEFTQAQKAEYKRGYLDGRAWAEVQARRTLEIAGQDNSQLRSRLVEAGRRATEAEQQASVHNDATERLQSCQNELELAERRTAELDAVVATHGAAVSRSTDGPRSSRRAGNQSSSAGKLSCDPNYSPCVPIASDVDCAGGSGNGPAYVSGPVRVVGTDIYGLDRDGDGIGCQ